MKVITEERLQDRYDSIVDEGSLYSQGAMDILDSLMQECQEIDTLTVTKLRPMTDAPIGESVLVVFNGGSAFHQAYIKTSQFLTIDDDQFGIDLFAGWIPVPTYEPEQK